MNQSSSDLVHWTELTSGATAGSDGDSAGRHPCVRAGDADRFGTDRGGYPGEGRHVDGVGSNARFDAPWGVAVDKSGEVYVGDYGAIRKIDSSGAVTTIAGSPFTGSVDGIGTGARFNYARGVAVDEEGIVYVADSGNSTIRKILPLGLVTTFAGLARSQGSLDGLGSDARFKGLLSVAVDSGGTLYVADTGNSLIRRVSAGRRSGSDLRNCLRAKRLVVLPGLLEVLELNPAAPDRSCSAAASGGFQAVVSGG